MLEDEPLIRLATTEVLEEIGCVVHQAEDGIEALARINEHSDIDVLVADVNLPGRLTGLQVGQLAALARPELRVVFTSGDESPDASDMPANSLFLSKPYRARQIREAVRAGA